MIGHIMPYLDSSLEYIKRLPLEERSIRIFCIIPFMLGYRTLVEIAVIKKDKISREEVARIVEKSSVCAGSNSILEKDYLEEKKKLLKVNIAFQGRLPQHSAK
jgi:hypothetical protein